MLRGMDEGDKFKVDPIFKDDQCILRKPVCMAAARHYPGFIGGDSDISVGSVGLAEEASEGERMNGMCEYSIASGSAWVHRS